MTKNYILDTNVLLQDPNSVFNFHENNLIIPIGVIEEIDKFKKDQGELGKNAREISRTLDKLSLSGDLKQGVDLENGFGGILRVYYNGNLHSYYKETNVDLHVIYVADQLSKLEPENQCVIVSIDNNVRIRARALGLCAENYENPMVKDVIDNGYAFVICPNDILDKLIMDQKISIFEIQDSLISVGIFNLYPNFYLAIEPETEIRKGKKDYTLAKVSYCGNFIEVLKPLRAGMRISPKNIEQTFVMDALLDDKIKFVSISGGSGCGKTLLSCCAGNYLVSKTDRYKKFLISRPMVHMGGKDTMGFMPGGIDEKLDPWNSSIYDNFEVMNSSKNKKQDVDGKKIVTENPKIKIEALAYIRGRSIHDQILLVDEAQNLSKLEVKTILTRMGENSKIIINGDNNQIDNYFLNSENNGLVTATECFIGSPLSAHFVLTHGLRSQLSDEASKRM